MTPTDPAPLQLDEIKARADAATRGPWEWEFPDYGNFEPGSDYHRRAGQHFSLSGRAPIVGSSNGTTADGIEWCSTNIPPRPGDEISDADVCVLCSAPYGNLDGDADPPETADAEFIAHAREDIPALIAEVERLREELWNQWEAAHAEYCTNVLPHADGATCRWPLPAALPEPGKVTT